MQAFTITAVALSPDEEHKARVAAQEVKQVENFHKTLLSWSTFCLAYLVQVLDRIVFHHNGSPDIFWYFLMAAFYPMVLGFGVWNYLRLKKRYPANLEFLSALREREGGFLKIEDEVYHPPALLDWWSRRLEQRAILWRVDRFLSGGRERGDPGTIHPRSS
jgi:hypothetical protein